ncbi:MAG TPA: T9SS type A sorting domain-containing protein [Flavobacteriales bacterium]|nr:T9SS type A sorting domain-containing protein [Flavobacteriales bacterium]
MEKQLLSTLFTGLGAMGAFAQPMVDITMAHNGADQIEVRLRPSADFNQVVSAVTFTVRWQEQFGPALSSIEPVFPQSEYVPVSSTPIVHGGNGFLYRTFNAIALVGMNDFGHAWQGGMEYPVCTLTVLTPGTQVELVNDDFTAANNRDFYVSLNGLPRTGSIYPGSGTTVNAMAINSGNGFMDVLLSPESDYFGWVNTIDFTLRWPAESGSMGAVVQEEPIASVLPLTKVGGEVTESGFTYQRFHGEGTMSMAVGQSAFWANEDHRIMRLPIIGSIGDATVTNDAWAEANDGGYSIVLNGHASAGSTDEAASSTGPEFSQVIPYMQVVGDELQASTSPEGNGNLVLTVYNAAGQRMAQRRAKWGTLVRINVASWPAGIYTMVATTDTGNTARRFVR